MRRSAIVAALIAIVILAAGIFVRGTITQPAIGNWLAAGSMTAARSGAASALLQDGRILITGGDNGSGPVANAEVFDTTGAFLAVPPMGMARSAHSATVLIDGRVLVAGGSTVAAATNAAEIFDPMANAWTPVAGGMIQARSNHTASLLADGRVLFAGGDNAGAPTAALEIFDPMANSFSSVGAMSVARTSFASATLADGRVMFIGGLNGSTPVASTEIFDPTNNTVVAGPALSAPRMAHSATTLLDGRVLVAGGTTVVSNPDGSTTNTDLASAEIYDPATGNLAVSASSLAAPRRDHAAFLLPNNNSVLIVGGTSSGSEVGTAELFLPSTGTFAPTGSPSVARQHATGSALSQDGILLLAGGSNSAGTLASAELYGFATVTTDKSDYAPGAIVTITGSGWQPGETVSLTMVESPFYDSHGPFTVVADSTGKIFNNQFSPDEHDVDIRFYLTAVGSVSGIQAQNTFTDANNPTLSVTIAGTGGGKVTSADGFISCTSGTCTHTYGGNFSTTLTETPNAGSGFAGWSGAGGCSGTATTCSANGSGNQTFSATATFNLLTAPVITSANNTTFTAGTAGTFTVTATGFPSPTFSETGALPSGVTLSSAGVLSGTPGANTGGSYTITITANNGVAPNGSEIFTLTVNNAVPTTTSISPASKNLGDPGFTLTVNGTNFVASSVVNFAGSARTTTFVNATQLTASILASDLLTAGTFNITVTNPAPGGGTSNSQTLTVNNLVPTTTSISPSSKNAGDAAFTLTVNGTNFVSTSVVKFNGSARTTTFVSAGQLTASITAADVATAGTFNITVTNPTPGGGTSNAQTLTVNNPVPTTTSISPTTKTVGDAAFTLTVNGTNFVAGSVVNFDGSPRSTTFVTATQVTAAITAADVVSAGTFNISVVNAAPGGGTSNTQVLTVNPKLVITTTAFTTVTGVCSPTITAQTQNNNGSASNGARTLALSGPATAKFFSDAACSTQISTVGILAGASSASFFYTDTAQGNSALTVGSTGLTSTSQTETYTGLRFGGNAFSVALGQCSSAFTVQSGPASGMPVSPSQNVTVMLSSSSANGKFYSDATCATQITTSLIGPLTDGGHDTNPIFYKDTSGGSPTITATAGTAMATQSETVTKITPTFTVPASQSITYGSASITLSGTIAAGSFFPPTTESVSITINSIVTPAAIGANGAFSAIVSTSATPASATAYTITYSYAGDTSFNSATNTATTLTVNKAATTTTVGTISPEPSNINQSYSVAWSVTVNAPGSGTPTGTVTVDDGNSNSCAAPVAAGSCSLASTSAGTKTITATYSGDSNFTGSAGTKSHVVNNPATTTAVSSSSPSNTSTFGDSVTFTATVTSAGGTPTGNVTFYDSATCSGTVLAGPTGLDVNGKTAFSTSTLNAASHTITACYAPTGIYLASSGSVTQTVNQAQATLSFDNLTFIYDGTPKPVTVTTTPANLTGVTVLYNGSVTPPTGPGATPVSASLSNANYTATPINKTELIEQAPTITSGDSTTFIAGTPGTFNVTTMGFPQASLMETGALPGGVSFTDNLNGTATLAGTATVAGSYPITIAASNGVGSPAMQAFTLVVTAGDFTKLQLLVPGETAAPGTASGKTGTPNTEYVNGAFNVIVNAVDANSNVVSSVTDTVNIASTDTDPNVKLPANAALVAGTSTLSVTLQAVSYNPAITTLTASDVTDSSKTASASPAIEVIIVYTAGIAPTMVATGDSVAYTLTVNNAAAPNTNTLRSVTVAIPTEGGTPNLVSLTAANAGPIPANWTADLSQISSHLLRFTQNTANDGVAPGGTISIQFTSTATNAVNGTVAQNVWTTTAFSDASYASALPLAGTEPTVSIGARPVITSADHTTNEFTYGAAGTFTVTTTGFPTPSLSQSAALPGGVAFKDNGDGTATLTGTPTAAGNFLLTITAHNGFGSDAVQTFTLMVNKATVTPSITADDKDYDGTTAATTHCTLSGVLPADMMYVTCSGTGNFADANAGPGKAVTSSNLVLGGNASGNYMLSTTTAATTATIRKKSVAPAITADDKDYDGTTAATIHCTLSGVLPADMMYVTCSGTGNFADANAGPGKAVTSSNLVLGGNASGNYMLSTTMAATTATIRKKSVAPAITADDKDYDGTTAATIHCTLSGVLPADMMYVTCSGTGNFADANAGPGKAVTSSNLVLGGNASGNYMLSTTTAATTATIRKKLVTASIAASDKIYDGNNTATITACTIPGKIGSDDVACSVPAGNATFASANAGQNPQTVTASGIILTGTTTGNYTLGANTSATTMATISPAPSTTLVAFEVGPYTYRGTAFTAMAVATGAGNFSTSVGVLYTGDCVNVTIGGCTATANFGGDMNHTASGDVKTIIIVPASSTTTLASSLNPSNWGDVVTLTATVTNTNNPAVLPTGYVSFYNSASGATCAAFGTSTLLDTEPLTTVSGNQQATTSTPNLPVGPGNTVGTDNILACFSSNTADPIFNPNPNDFMSSNGTIAQTVNPAPIVTLAPANLSFGNQQGGTASGAQTVTVCNGPSGVSGSTCFNAPVSTAALSIASIGFTNSNTSPVYFTQTNTCPINPATLAVGGSCVISVKFAPPANASGLASALITLTDNNRNVTGSLQSASLTGSGSSSISGVGSLSTYALFATASGCSSVSISGNGTVDSYNGLANSGNVGTNGNATLSGNPVVNGAIYSPVAGTGNCSGKALTGLSTSGKAQATGGLQTLSGPVNYPLPPAPSPAPPTTTQNISGSCGTVSGCTGAGGSKSVHLAPGGYGNLSATGGTTLHLSVGTYNFNSLTLSGNSILYLDSGPIVINLAGASLSASGTALDLSGGSIVNPSGVTSNLQFYYAGSKAFKLSGGTGSYAMVYAPNAAINISGGAHFYGSIVGTTINSSGNTAVHYDGSETAINVGQTIWFNSGGLNVQGLPNTGSVKLYITNAMITFTANGIGYMLPVPNAVVTFSSSVSSASTTWDATNNRWSTLIPMSSVKGNATIHSFFDGLAYQVPTNFPGGIQNVTWQAAYSTSTPGLNFNWQWGAAVYGAFAPYSSLQISALDNADPAGTPESQKGNLVFGDMGAGYTGLYAGTTAVVPTIAPLSFSQSSLDFGSVPSSNPSSPQMVTLMNNDSVPYTINAVNGIQYTGTYAGDFAITNNCPISPNSLAAGGSCTFTITLTPTAPSGTKETVKIVVNDNANNSPQTVFVKGTVQ